MSNIDKKIMKSQILEIVTLFIKNKFIGFKNLDKVKSKLLL